MVQSTHSEASILPGDPDDFGAPEEAAAAPGCARPRFWLRYRMPDGRLVPVACGSPNLCDFCRFMGTLEYSVMVLQDAQGSRPPNFGVTTTTVRVDTTPEEFRRCSEAVVKLLRRELGSYEQLGHIEFFTGKSRRSGGFRRIHQHGLGKVPADVPVSQVLALEPAVSAITERMLGAPRVEVAELRTAAGAAHYLTHHHSKKAQLPPKGWTGTRFRPTRGYFDRPADERRRLAKAQLLDDRLRRSVTANLLAVDDQVGGLDGEEWNAALTSNLDHAREVAAQGVELVRVQQVPTEFGVDGLPSAWTVEVLGLEAEMR